MREREPCKIVTMDAARGEEANSSIDFVLVRVDVIGVGPNFLRSAPRRCRRRLFSSISVRLQESARRCQLWLPRFRRHSAEKLARHLVPLQPPANTAKAGGRSSARSG
jgi:hypothetical protein